jgi:hypothetical protein
MSRIHLVLFGMHSTFGLYLAAIHGILIPVMNTPCLKVLRRHAGDHFPVARLVLALELGAPAQLRLSDEESHALGVQP